MAKFNPVASMLRTLLSMPNVDPRTQQRIYTYAISTRDTKLLSELAGRHDLEDDLDRKLASVTAANVRAAWLGHPRRTIDDLKNALENENRSSVAKSLAGREDLPEHAYELLVTKLGINSLPTLMSNNAVSPAVRTKAVKRYAELANSDSRSTPETVCDVLAANSDLAAVALETTSSLALLDTALNTVIPEPAQANRIARIVASRCENTDYSETTWRERNLREDITTRIEPYLLDTTLRHQLADALTSSGTGGSRSGITARLRKARRKYTPSVETMRTTTSEQVIVNTISKAFQNSTPVLPLLAALADNPACSPALFAELTLNHTRRWGDRALWRSITDSEKAAALYCAWPWTDLDPMLARTTDPAQTLRMIIETTLESNHSLSSAVLSSTYLTADIAHLLPIETFGYGAEYIPVEALEVVEEMLNTRLTSDHAWDTLAVLGREYRGPLGQLLDTAEKLS